MLCRQVHVRAVQTVLVYMCVQCLYASALYRQCLYASVLCRQCLYVVLIVSKLRTGSSVRHFLSTRADVQHMLLSGASKQFTVTLDPLSNTLRLCFGPIALKS